MALIDFAILSGLVEELEVTKQLCSGMKEIWFDNEVWYRGWLRSENGSREYSVVAAFQDDMGPLHAHALTVRALKRWKPAHIIVVGIAGSMDEELRLGDLVVSQQVFYYDPGKAKDGGISYRPQGYPCSPLLIRQAEALTVDGASLSALHSDIACRAKELAMTIQSRNPATTKRRRAELEKHKPSVYVGTIASGSLVVSDVKKKKELLALHGKMLATEMEGAGVMHAAFDAEIPTPAIVIKGISDAADAKKSTVDQLKYWRMLAKENPVRFVVRLIQRGRFRAIGTDDFDLHSVSCSPGESRQLIKDVSGGRVAYLGFTQLIKPSGPMTAVKIAFDARGQKRESLLVSQAVVTFRNYDGLSQRKDFSGKLRELKIQEPMAAFDIGVYLLIHGNPHEVAFDVTSAKKTQRAEWRAASSPGREHA